MSVIYWIGGTSTDASVAANYQGGVLPTVGDIVLYDDLYATKEMCGDLSSAGLLTSFGVVVRNLPGETHDIHMRVGRTEIGAPDPLIVKAQAIMVFNNNFNTVTCNTIDSYGYYPNECIIDSYDTLGATQCNFVIVQEDSRVTFQGLVTQCVTSDSSNHNGITKGMIRWKDSPRDHVSNKNGIVSSAGIFVTKLSSDTYPDGHAGTEFIFEPTHGNTWPSAGISVGHQDNEAGDPYDGIRTCRFRVDTVGTLKVRNQVDAHMEPVTRVGGEGITNEQAKQENVTVTTAISKIEATNRRYIHPQLGTYNGGHLYLYGGNTIEDLEIDDPSCKITFIGTRLPITVNGGNLEFSESGHYPNSDGTAQSNFDLSEVTPSQLLYVSTDSDSSTATELNEGINVAPGVGIWYPILSTVPVYSYIALSSVDLDVEQ